AAIEVLGVQRLAARMRDKVFIKELEVGLAELAVAVPPHGVLGGCVDDRMLVLRRAAGVHAGFGADRAALHDSGVAGRNRMLVKLGRVEIPMNCSKIFEAELVGTAGAVPHTRLFHANPPLKSLGRAPASISRRRVSARLGLNTLI